ncbi:MAG: hypothetical protein US60_C0002G0014 [Microgenomates group bacterium GW2011_GWC1_37_8]|uniref:Uncharacterized protein n=1 Tax=Candidatus Woesebacteria bacterium GW2011_GWB1_38_8 TaxID=1618570 RepID=A0A0G0L358_9BACT|nr:MAG: hypothetical protein US60_C0002G0014 [Microgenomates group bacterium GW2011_GWC1_37_8]KKQ85452.1 MAG: hypothetical protein UT08_C0006G0035 [Candidatus Woesebacteria bacterium GW2011_GWB1_38_8]
MSKIFYDHLIILEEIEVHIGNIAKTFEEKEEIWKLIDELIHYRVFNLILDHLPRDHNEEFIEKFHKAPYDGRLLTFINERTQQDMEKVIRQEIKLLENEILEEIKGYKNE